MDDLLSAFVLTLSDEVVIGLLWIGIVAGVFAFLGWCAEKCCDAFDSWADSISTHYVDEP